MTSPLLLVILLGAAQSTGQMSPTSDVSSNRVKATGSSTARALRDAMRDLYGHAPGAPAARADGRASLVSLLRDLNTQGSKRVTWVGDSITEQGKTAGQGFTTQIQALYPSITYSNQGTGGDTTLDVIARLATVKATAADLYVVAVGVNDARYNDARGAATADAYVSNMATIVTSLQEGGKSVAVLSIWPTYWKDQYAALGRKATDDRIVQWNQALAKYCAAAGVVFVNAHDAIRAAVDLQNVATLAPDGVHPDYDGSYIGTAGAALYANAVLGGDTSKGRHSAAYQPSGSVFYKLLVYDHGNATDYASIQSIITQPAVSEFFAYSGNPAVDPTGLFSTAYNASSAGFLNKAADWPAVITFSSSSVLSSAITVERALDLGIRSYDLFVSTDPRALVDPAHPSWVLVQSERSNAALAHNLLPAERQGYFYRLKIDSSTGTDGTGGTTGIYVKVAKIWGGVPPVRWSAPARLAAVSRTDRVFSATGGDADGYLANQADVYPLDVMWESPVRLNLLTIGSVADNTRAVKDWHLYVSRDPDSLTTTAHSSWLKIRQGTGDQTINLRYDGGVAAYVDPSTVTTNVAQLAADLNALRTSLINAGILPKASMTGVPTQNLLQWSQAFDTATSGAVWFKGNALTLTPNNVVAPDGTTTATTAATGASGSPNLEYQGGLSLTSGTSYTASLHLKYVDNAWYRLLIYDGAGTNIIRAWFNIQTGAVGTVSTAGSGSAASANIAAAANGFYRVEVTGTVAWSPVYVMMSPTTGDNTSSGAYNTSCVVWGAQLNEGSPANAYTATTDTASP